MAILSSPLSRPALAALALALAACVPTGDAPPRPETRVGAKPECGQTTGSGCFFRNAPVRLKDDPVQIPGRPYQFFPTARAFSFVDGTGSEWQAPAATLTDGASIPRALVPVVGDPRTPEFANAAALHDAYCGVGNEGGPAFHSLPWQDVHRMFYDTLLVGGTPRPKAQLMFSAVWLGGPRWHPTTGHDDTRMQRMPKDMQQTILRETKGFIDREDPDLPRLVSYLEWQEKKLDWMAHGGRNWKAVKP